MCNTGYTALSPFDISLSLSSFGKLSPLMISFDISFFSLSLFWFDISFCYLLFIPPYLLYLLISFFALYRLMPLSPHRLIPPYLLLSPLISFISFISIPPYLLLEIEPMHLSVEGLRPWDWSYPVLQYFREWPTPTVVSSLSRVLSLNTNQPDVNWRIITKKNYYKYYKYKHHCDSGSLDCHAYTSSQSRFIRAPPCSKILNRPFH